jgi:hypothetical protein
VRINTLKPGTIVKYCLPSLHKLVEPASLASTTEQTAVPAANPVETTSNQEAVVSEKVEKTEAPAVPKAPKIKKRDIVYKYRKGKVDVQAREGSLRKQAYDLALADPSALAKNEKLKNIANALVRLGWLEHEA